MRIPLYSDPFGAELGELIIDGEYITAKTSESKIRAPVKNMTEVTLVDRTQLGKVRARIVIYDFLGNKNVITAILTEPNFFLLRGFLNK